MFQFIRHTLHRKKCLTVPQMCIRVQKAEFDETSWFCIVSILINISHCQQKEKKETDGTQRKVKWMENLPILFFSPLTNWKVTATLCLRGLQKLQEQKGQFTPACGNPACSTLTCLCYTTSCLLHSPSSIWSNNRVVYDNYGKSQEEKSTVAG